jgi:hypothetical protein
MNETLKNAAKTILKELLAQCTEGQQMMFKRMYSHNNLEQFHNVKKPVYC